MLRNPADRAFSAYRYAVQRSMEDKSFQDAIDDELTGRNKDRSFEEQNQKMYVEHGYYNKQIGRLLNYFGRDQLFVGLYEDMLDDKEKLMRDIFEFLEVAQPSTFQEMVGSSKISGVKNRELSIRSQKFNHLNKIIDRSLYFIYLIIVGKKVSKEKAGILLKTILLA